MTLQRKTYPFLPDAVGPYAHAVKHGTALYLSGLTAYGTKAQSGTTQEQAEEILHQIASIAVAEGTDLRNLIKVTIFVTDMSTLGNLRQLLSQAYGCHLPASSLVEVKGLVHPDLKIEMEAILAT
ncbi:MULTISPECIES: RidA family protein [Pseudovibrio]|uniref:RidA family protein n=1 Tax=Stappiaceae TaxID=2821832 RepID=UPI002366D351|nr:MULTISPECIES: RidA family protein [Pseudovibrio]MDD7912119.1 RidA family protein [Pseudovibrio exalbescens]MDX5592467.1 RidA family protein [Pseudovibrio sp. SPO723]